MFNANKHHELPNNDKCLILGVLFTEWEKPGGFWYQLTPGCFQEIKSKTNKENTHMTQNVMETSTVTLIFVLHSMRLTDIVL